MTRCADGEVLIRDLSLRCGQKVFEVSLWRDKALIDLSLGAQVEISHLKATLRPDSEVKVHNIMQLNYSLNDLSSSSYTCECVPSGYTFLSFFIHSLFFL